MTSTNGHPLALVTGASSGIGLELAKQFAASGFDWIVVAEDAEIDSAGAQIDVAGRGSVEIARIDLASDGGVDELYGLVRSSGRPLTAAALNAGIGAGGAFATDTRLEDELRLIDLNVRSTVHLAKLVVADMVQRGGGRILFTSSIASTMPGASRPPITRRSRLSSPSRSRCARSLRTPASRSRR